MKTETKQRPLTVRRRIWHKNEPKLEMLTTNGWHPTPTYEAARRYAKRYGYSGIRVRVV